MAPNRYRTYSFGIMLRVVDLNICIFLCQYSLVSCIPHTHSYSAFSGHFISIVINLNEWKLMRTSNALMVKSRLDYGSRRETGGTERMKERMSERWAVEWMCARHTHPYTHEIVPKHLLGFYYKSQSQKNASKPIHQL